MFIRKVPDGPEAATGKECVKIVFDSDARLPTPHEGKALRIIRLSGLIIGLSSMVVLNEEGPSISPRMCVLQVRQSTLAARGSEQRGGRP